MSERFHTSGLNPTKAPGIEPGVAGVLPPGHVVGGQFEVVRYVGQGGMGVVYDARDRLSGERVALKTILPVHVSHPKAVERFLREMKIARRLRHPNIVTVYNVGQDGPLLFLAMEFLEGKSLRQVLQEWGRVELETAVALLRQLCDALEYAHRFLVHRDLSPENLMVLPNGEVKLLDFGLARTAGQATVTATGVTLGKAHYMSPEQRKDAARVDARTDLYALGVMFFEMLTGQLPLGVKTAVDLNPELPVGCDVLIGHCLAPLEDRIKTVGEFRVGLNKCIEEALPTEPGGERASEKGEPVPGRRTWAFRSGVVLSGAALCLAAWFMGSRIRESMRPPEPPRVETSNAAQQESSTTPPDTAPAPEPEPEPAAPPKPESEEQAGPEAPNSSTPDAKSEPKPADPAKAIESLEGISMLRGDWMGWEGSTPKDPKQDKPQCAASFAGNRFTILKANERLLLGNKTQWDLEGTFTTDISAKPYKILLEGKQSLENSLKSPFACDGIFEVDKDQLRLSLGSPGEHRVLQFGGNWKDLVLNRIR